MHVEYRIAKGIAEVNNLSKQGWRAGLVVHSKVLPDNTLVVAFLMHKTHWDEIADDPVQHHPV